MRLTFKNTLVELSELRVIEVDSIKRNWIYIEAFDLKTDAQQFIEDFCIHYGFRTKVTHGTFITTVDFKTNYMMDIFIDDIDPLQHVKSIYRDDVLKELLKDVK